ncbi:MAG TPA: DsbA family protein [Propylenella sp.]
MSGIRCIAATVLALLLLAVASPVRAEMSGDEKREVEKVIRDYLLTNPEILEEAINALRAKREEAAAVEQANAIEENGDLIFGSEHQMVLGNPDGAITLVEFFDYNCGYCKRAVSDMVALLDGNPDLKIVMKEFPILSEGSAEAARVSIAVKDVAPESYLKFHQELFTRPGQANAAKALEVAVDLGLDKAVIETAAASESVTENLQEVHRVATMLGITGTPSYVLGTELVPGAIGFDKLQTKVASVRECGKTLC